MPSVLWRCWLGCRKGIRPVKTEWWGAGVVICLEQGADLHMAQLMPLPLTVSCSSKIQIGFTFLVPAYPGSPGQRAVKRVLYCAQKTLLPLYRIGQERRQNVNRQWPYDSLQSLEIKFTFKNSSVVDAMKTCWQAVPGVRTGRQNRSHARHTSFWCEVWRVDADWRLVCETVVMLSTRYCGALLTCINNH